MSPEATNSTSRPELGGTAPHELTEGPMLAVLAHDGHRHEPLGAQEAHGHQDAVV